jgi:crotonobetainyl-CoA:carnitine CoA-transferase CaiB-like acyl-CoA transferase
MSGVRVVEVAEHTFVPAAAGLLSDWGADVVKIEPIERGDAVRGLSAMGAAGVHVLHEHSNRGKRSLELNLAEPDGVEILYELVATADVFMTNKVGRVREKLKIEVGDLRARNPNLIYVRGTGWGERGAEADRGGYDLLGFWHRSGASMGTAGPTGEAPFLPGPGFGDSIGAMTIAGGVMGALFHRERTGDASVVDVSLLSTGMWAMGAAIASAGLVDDWTWPPAAGNPLSASYRTSDRRWLALCCLQAGHYWAPLCETIGRPDLGADARFQDHASIIAHGAEARALLRDVFAARTLDDWCERFHDFSGQWTVVQDARAAGADPQAVANGYVHRRSLGAGASLSLVAAPVQYDELPATPSPAPDLNEHGDAILADLGLDGEALVDLKLRGVVG